MGILQDKELTLDSNKIKEYDKKYNLHSWSAQKKLDPLVVTRAEGIYFWDSTGNW